MIVLSFLLTSAVGWLLLLLPVSSAGEPLAPIDALFMSVTAVCVTGLTVVNTGADLSHFGHVVILCLIQIGGLNYMVISTAFMVLMGKRIELSRRFVLREAIGSSGLGSVVSLWHVVILFTFVTEALGAIVLSLVFAWRYHAPAGHALWLGIFHSVSAFCNAGLDLFGRPTYGAYFGRPDGFASLAAFAGDPLVMLTIAALIVLGGLGFVVVLDVINHAGRRRLSTHTQIVLVTTAALIVLGAVAVLVLEGGNPATLGSLGPRDRVIAALFQSITPRTAGFCWLDQAAMLPSSKLLTIALMFIGASPGGTGGGIKTTTFVIILLAALASIRGDEDVELFGRRVSHATVYRALTVAFFSLVIVATMTFAFSLAEADAWYQPGDVSAQQGLLDYIFEACSAFGTVGLSTGVTAELSAASKLGVIVTMLFGRIGPVTLAVALAERRRLRHRRYPEGSVMIG